MNASGIKWVVAGESYYKSADGRIEIMPLYCGRERPQGWEVVDNQTKHRRRVYFPLKEAKRIGAEMVKGRGQ